MAQWPRHPIVYEINTWVWLYELSEHARGPITLGNVPKKQWDAIAAYGFDAVWFMGVWERSPCRCCDLDAK
ncbi:MAG: Alpha amylase, catalytic region [Nitrospira sp.]|nr:Alpha amylase, catalytic region [Nitrospira sp.]